MLPATAAGATGRSMKNVVPTPSVVSKPMEPPMRSTSSLEMASPSPVPPRERVSDASACENFSKIEERNSSGMPGPESWTQMRTQPSPRIVDT